MQKLKVLLPYIVIIAILLGTVLSLFQSGFFAMHDDTQVSRIYLMSKSLADGLFPVRWVEDLGYGYGYPIFNFYAPFPYYLGGIFTLILGNSLTATKLIFGIAMVGAGLSMYYFVRKFLGVFAGITAGVLYAYFPYHAVNMYVRGNLSELYAYIFIPLFLSSVYSLYYAKEKKLFDNFWNIVLLALTLALIIISHNLSAYMTLLLSSLLILASLLIRKKKKIYFLSIVVGIVGGVLLSAFYWLPALLEMRFTDVNSQIGGGSDFRDHFVCVAQLWQSNWGFGGSVPGCTDGMSFMLGKSNIFILILSAIVIIFATIKRKIAYRFFVVSSIGLLALSLLLVTPISRPIWDVIPGMEYLQFPWRFLNFVGLYIAVLGGFLVWVTTKISSKKAVLVVTVTIIVVTILINHRYFAPQEIFDRDDNFYTNREYISFDVTKRSDEYLPPDFNVPESKTEIPEEKISVPEYVTVNEWQSKTGLYEAEIVASSAARLHFNIAYYPAWHVFINNEEVSVTRTSQGFTARVPEGTYVIRAEFIQTPVQRAGNYISLLGLILLFAGIIRKQTYDRQHAS